MTAPRRAKAQAVTLVDLLDRVVDRGWWSPVTSCGSPWPESTSLRQPPAAPVLGRTGDAAGGPRNEAPLRGRACDAVASRSPSWRRGGAGRYRQRALAPIQLSQRYDRRSGRGDGVNRDRILAADPASLPDLRALARTSAAPAAHPCGRRGAGARPGTSGARNPRARAPVAPTGGRPPDGGRFPDRGGAGAPGQGPPNVATQAHRAAGLPEVDRDDLGPGLGQIGEMYGDGEDHRTWERKK
jgi:hypothetical protein